MAERSSRQWALRAFENAEDLLEEAELLLQHGRPARALGLSILGKEEVAKALILAAAAAGKLPGWDLNAIRKHFIKHLVADALMDAVALVDELADTLEGIAPEVGPLGSRWHADQVLSQMASWFREDLEDARAGDRKAARVFRDRKKETPRACPETPEERKWRCFYVDPSRPLDEQPTAVSGEDAWEELAELRRALRVTTWIRKRVEDKEVWADFLSEKGRIS